MDRIYRVCVDHDVAIDCLLPDSPAFGEARKAVIQRGSAAIERFHDNAAKGALKGTYFFENLDNARSFALMNLQATQQRLAANMDRILRYDGRG